MAVKKVGQDKSKIRKATCKHCAAKLEFLPKDVKMQRSPKGCGPHWSYNYVVCPQCSQRVEVR